jgi:hypothetical protein
MFSLARLERIGEVEGSIRGLARGGSLELLKVT